MKSENCTQPTRFGMYLCICICICVSVSMCVRIRIHHAHSYIHIYIYIYILPVTVPATQAPLLSCSCSCVRLLRRMAPSHSHAHCFQIQMHGHGNGNGNQTAPEPGAHIQTTGWGVVVWKGGVWWPPLFQSSVCVCIYILCARQKVTAIRTRTPRHSLRTPTGKILAHRRTTHTHTRGAHNKNRELLFIIIPTPPRRLFFVFSCYNFVVSSPSNCVLAG